MSGSDPAPDYEYAVYIDESGDSGLQKVFPVDPDGASEWFGLSAVVVFKKREAETVEWIQDIRDQAGVTQGPAMHFHRLTRNCSPPSFGRTGGFWLWRIDSVLTRGLLRRARI